MSDLYIYILDDFFFFCVGLLLLYFFVFAVASHFKSTNYERAKKQYRCAFLIPETNMLPPDHKDESYEIITYKDLTEAVQQLDKERFQMVAILSNKTSSLSARIRQEIEDSYSSGIQAIQFHTVIQNRKGAKARFRAILDEINNSIYRAGNTQLGLSSVSMGTNIVYDLEWLRNNLKSNKTNLERKLFRQNIYIEYLPEAIVYCESAPTYPYRKRIKKTLSFLLPSIIEGNWNFCNRIVQQLTPSPLRLFIGASIWTIFMTIYDWTSSLKWWFILFGLAITYSLAIPNYLVEDKKKKKH